MAATWPLSRIRAKVRSLTGRPSTDQISDNDIDDFINDYYVNKLPVEISLPEAEGFYSFDTDPTVGTYAVPEDIIDIRSFTIDDGDGDAVIHLRLWHNREDFFTLHPEDAGAAEADPTDILWIEKLFYVRPIPDSILTIQGWAKRRPTTELTIDASLPLQSSWGMAMAYGAAIEIFIDDGDAEGANELKIQPFGYDYQLRMITSKEVSRLVGLRAKPQI
ncbi:hypothetical protein LCGC14_1223910 [marine sediment metagenome]|uniref:Uncharacterized protein n=1 Tax=marine sediment metagenome TaxID=412755 RepID=A0A0F9PEX1_9ZZZZ